MQDDRWDPLFDDLENQFSAQREAERNERDDEAERVRVAGIDLADRLNALVGSDLITLAVRDGEMVRGAVRSVGADWCALRTEQGASLVIVPLGAVRGAALSSERARASLAGPARRALESRMTLGFALRTLARRRVPVRISRGDAGALTGTLARAGSDHVDIALHEGDVAPRASDVAGLRIVPFDAITAVRIEAHGGRGLL